MRRFILFLMLLTQIAFAQTDFPIIRGKMTPLVFQVEKQLATQIKSTLEESLKIKDISVRTSLRIDPAIMARKYNLLPKKSKFLLPGLDESATNFEENLKNFNPTIQDVYLSLSELNVIVSSLIVFTDVEKGDIEKVVADDLSTLNLRRINYSFLKSKNLEIPPAPVEETKVEVPKARAPEPPKEIVPAEKPQEPDYSQWLLVGIVALGGLLVITIFLVGYLLVRQFKNMAKSLSGAISQIDLAPEKSPGAINSSGSQDNKLTTVDDSQKRIQKQFSQIKDKRHFYKTFASNFSGIRFYVICECLSPDEREELKKCLSSNQYKEYLLFLQTLASGTITNAQMAEVGDQISRDISLYLHDAGTFVDQTMKNKIRTLDRKTLKQLIEQSDESDFIALAQYCDPIEMSLILSEDPALINKFDSLEVREVAADELSALTSKLEVDDEIPCHQFALNEDLKLREFVPENIEMLLNRKLGKERTLWEELDENGKVSLYDFTIGLPVKEASMFVSIIPEGLRDDVLTHLPDLKRQQIKRHGFEISRRSMELKHEFFKMIRAS